MKKIIRTNRVEYKWRKALDNLLFFYKDFMIPEKWAWKYVPWYHE